MDTVKCDHCQTDFAAKDRFWCLEQDQCCSTKCLRAIEEPRRPVVKVSSAPYRKADCGGNAAY